MRCGVNAPTSMCATSPLNGRRKAAHNVAGSALNILPSTTYLQRASDAPVIPDVRLSNISRDTVAVADAEQDAPILVQAVLLLTQCNRHLH